MEQDSDTEVAVELTKHFKLKVINHNRKSEYKVFNIRNNKNFDLQIFGAMKKFILNNIPADVSKPTADTFEFGFIDPGHGLNGKKEWLYSDEDIKDMIRAHKGRSVTLWCYNCKKPVTRSRSPTPSRSKQGDGSRSRSPHRSNSSGKSKGGSSSSKSATGGTKASRYESQMQKIAAVDEIYRRLEEKYRGKYTPEQLRAWAHMIDLKKHSSYDEPPNKPFFVGKQKATKDSEVTSTPQKASVAMNSGSMGVSPGKRVNLRSECIDQLQSVMDGTIIHHSNGSRIISIIWQHLWYQ